MKKHFFTAEYWQERDMELFLGKFLRFGVTLSCAITLLGGILYLWQQGGIMPDYAPSPENLPFEGVEQNLRSVSSILQGMLQGNGASIIQFGVLVLIATPILRVAISAIAFLIEKDYLYVVITLIVLAIIIANMLLGLH